MTFFEKMKRSYKDVDATNGINTTQFLEASESLVTMFDLLGSAAFSVVKSDMNGNIKKIRDRQLAAPLKSETLQDLAANEYKEHPKNPPATEGMLWLIRGLAFTATALRLSVKNPSQELSVSFTDGYEKTLKVNHGIMLAMKACPYRKVFYQKLGSDQEVVKEQMEAWLTALEDIVLEMQTVYATNNYIKKDGQVKFQKW